MSNQEKMKDRFDVIIVGAGPGGLECARILKDSPYSVLIVERKRDIGPKPCAGGIVESVEPFDLPDDKTRFFHNHTIRINQKDHPISSIRPIRIIDRSELGRYQFNCIESASNIDIRTGTKVTNIEKGAIHVGAERLGYRFLVGADGASSMVARHLDLKPRYTLGIYYDIPDIKEDIILNIDGRLLKTSYIWEFPHQTFTNVGIHYHPKHFSGRQAYGLLLKYMQQNRYPIYKETNRAFPISYKYHGCRFKNNIFLVGDAAGLASKLTGEGIAYALISGREVARKIIDPNYGMPSLRRLLWQKKQQHRIINFFERIPLGLNGCFFLFLQAYRMGLITLSDRHKV